MTGLDTNVLVRFILQDDLPQSPKADTILESLTVNEPGWIGIATLLELVWVLNSGKRLGRSGIGTILSQLVAQETILVEQADVVEKALLQYRRGKADFADCLIAASAQAAGCSRALTFDRVAARDTTMELVA